MNKSISTFGLLESIGKKATLAELGIMAANNGPCLQIKSDFPNYIEPYLTVQFGDYNLHDKIRPSVILISAAGATGKTTMCQHLSSKLNIPVFDLGIAREVASNSLTGALVKEFDAGYGSFRNAVRDGKQSIIIDALDEGLVKSGSGSFLAFIDDVLSLASDKNDCSVSIIMFGRNQAVNFVSDYLAKSGIDFVWLQISAFTIEQAGRYVDMMVKPSNKYSNSYKELKQYIFDAIGSFVDQQSKVSDNFLGYAPVLDAISTAIKQKKNYRALLEEYRKCNVSGISFILNVISEIIRREKEDKVNEFIKKNKNDLTKEEYDKALAVTYDCLEQCKALMECIHGESHQIQISAAERINAEFTKHMKSFIEDHPFLNGKRFENTVFESYVLAKLMIEDPDNIYLQSYLVDIYRDAYMLFYFLVELTGGKTLDWQYIPYAYRSLNSFDNRKDHGQTSIVQNNNGEVHEINMARPRDRKELSCFCKFDRCVKFTPGSIVSNLTIDSDKIDIVLDAKTTEIVPPVVCVCRNVKVAGDIYINASKDKSIEDDDRRIIFECDSFEADFSSGHRPSLTKEQKEISLSISSAKKPDPPFTEYYCDSKLPEAYTEEFKNAFVKLRKILITFRSHSKGSMARYKGKIDDSRISGYDFGKCLINKLLNEGIIYEQGCMYVLDRDMTACKLGLTFDKLQATTPTQQMEEFLNTVLSEMGK